jgi:membrane protein DedA with SNARE-associated domain
MESVQGLAEWLAALPPLGIYGVLLGVSYLENLVPPIWGDTLVVLCGWLVGVGTLAFVPTVLLATLGGSLGFMTLYAIGRRLDTAIADPSRLRWIPRKPLAAAERWLRRWGMGVVAANRFLAGGRSVISLLAGASRLSAGATAFWATFSAFLWCGALVMAGAWVGNRWEVVLEVLGAYGQVITGLLAVVFVAVVVRWWISRRGETAQETAKTPLEGDEGAPRR